jgi:hypothetical protein
MKSWSALAVVVAVLHCLLFLTVVLLRIRYPYELEWIEGGILQHVQRVVAGKPLYVPPTLEWTPLIYGPLYYYVSAAAVRAMGDGFLPLRLVSFASSVGIAFLLYWLVRRETGSRIVGFFAGAFFIAGYKTMGSWYDIARVDGVFVFLLLGAIVAYRCFRGAVSAWIGATLLALAFLAKQTTLLAILPMVIWGFWRQPRRTLHFAVPAGVAIAAIALVAQARTDGWFLYYTMGLAGRHPIVKSILIEFWIGDVLTPSSIAVLFAAAFFFLGREQPSQSRTREFYGAIALGLGGAAWGSRLHDGGWFNVLMPGFAALAILFGLGIDTVARAIERRGGELKPRLAALLYLGIALQFIRTAYNPFQEIPSLQDRLTGDRIVETLARAPGDVYVPDHPYLAERAGKGGLAHRAALADILRIEDERAREFEQQLAREFEERRFVAALIDNSQSLPMLGDDFEKADDLIRDDSFWPVVGMKTRPEFLFLRREE